MSRRSSTGSRQPAGRILHLDTFSGIAGNMFLAALLDLGLSRKELEADLAGLDLPFRLVVRRVQRGALAARYLDVRVPAAKKKATKKKAARKHGHHHHVHHVHGRTYVQIRDLLEKARLEEPVRERALAIFEALARAEAKVHGTKIEDVHFHEVGAVDAIVDVTGAAIGLHRLGIERVTATPVALGHGSVDTAHGRLPLPAPATLELLAGIPTVPAHVEWETVTPTGAAILRVVVDEFRQLPAMTVEAVGHGAGNEREGAMPNVLRAVLGRSGGPHFGLIGDRVVSLETNLDDLVPEHFEYLMERLFEAGALDVSIQHLQMKKNRPGFLVRVLGRPADRHRLSGVLFAESTAIGVRATEFERLVLRREARRVSTPYGSIGVKVVWNGDGRPEVSAEVDDCVRAARRADVSLRDVIRAAEEKARSDLL
ncbi:MAG: nickel pincer cofactor biosynthesis protein LarC [Proteobacteria bacterium]|nr:nickel pincer cofactor biosynthesis protein LarC [Pseudomonadota bacterium]